MSHYKPDHDDMFNSRWLSDKLKGYRIEGDIVELYNVIFSNARIMIHLRDIIHALSDCSTNYIRVGYGETINEAYKETGTKGNACRLVHIFCSEEGLAVEYLYNFISSLGEDIIFGYTVDNAIGCKIKLVLILN